MKLLLGVESLEPRALFAGLCDIPSVGMPAPVVSVPAPAAEIGPMLGDVDESMQAPLGPPIVVDLAPPEVANPDSTPIVNQPGESGDLNTEQTKPPGVQNPPSEADKPAANVESETLDPNPWGNSEVKSDTSDNAPADSLSQSCSADPSLAPKAAVTPPPFAAFNARSGSATAPPFVSLFVTSSSTLQARQLTLTSGERGDGTEDSSGFHYFEPSGTHRLDGNGLGYAPLANVAARETFVAFWLMTKQDLEELQGLHAALDTADVTTEEACSEPIAAREQDDQFTSQQTDVVHRALAAMSSADDVLREAQAVCAVAVSATDEPTSIAETAISQALACSAAKSIPLASRHVTESQPSNPRWQLGMCSLVSILFSFRSPTKSSVKPWKRHLTKAARCNSAGQ